MIVSAAVAGIDIVTIGAALALAAYITDRTLDGLGWSRSSKNLRRENEDLVRRNGELEDTVARHEADIARMLVQIENLEKTNLAAAILKIGEHEASALIRHKENALRGEQQLAQGQQTLELLGEIRDSLRTPDFQSHRQGGTT